MAIVWELAGPPTAVAEREADELAYLALGDSVAAGADIGERQSYPRRLGERVANETGKVVRYWNRARPGEQSGGVLAFQLDSLSEFRPRLVTVTVGANDFLIPALECVAMRLEGGSDDACGPPDPRVTIPMLESNLRQIIRRVLRESDAIVALTTYYNPFPRASRCAPSLVDISIRFLNGAIVRAAADFGERVVLVDLMDVFRGHEGIEPAGWFSRNPLRLGCTDIHPNPSGQVAIADAVWNALAARANGR